MSIVLFEDQKPLIRALAKLYKDGIKAAILQLATGGGKTVCGAYVAEQYLKTGRVVLWLVHREELLMQAALTFAKFGIKHRLICAASSERAIKAQQFRELGASFVDAGSNLIIASKPTIVRRLDKLDWLKPDQIFADEAHLSLADDWRRVIERWPEARLCGLTATPTRLDKKPFHKRNGGLYEAMVCGKPPHELIAEGRLSKYRVWAPPVHLRKDVKVGMKGGDFNPNDLELELDDPVVYGDVIQHYRTYSEGLPAIGFCPNVRSANSFAAKFNEAGYKAIALEGNTDDTIRRNAILQLGRGEIDVIFSVGILIEGTDIPYATTALWLCRTTSLVKYLQGTGRVLRAHRDKDYARILDFVGVVALHGLPDEEREWSLEEDSGRRRSAAANDNDALPDISIMTCSKCHAIHKPAPKCPACGHVHEVKERKEMEQVDGDLEELTREKAEALKRARELRMLQGKAKTKEDLITELGKRNIRGRRAEIAADKILDARAKKNALIEAVYDGIDEVQRATGQSPFRMFGVTMGDIRRMKPKALKELLAIINDSRNDNSEVIQISNVA